MEAGWGKGWLTSLTIESWGHISRGQDCSRVTGANYGKSVTGFLYLWLISESSLLETPGLGTLLSFPIPVSVSFGFRYRLSIFNLKIQNTKSETFCQHDTTSGKFHTMKLCFMGLGCSSVVECMRSWVWSLLPKPPLLYVHNFFKYM
jgi:hypothetical protein